MRSIARILIASRSRWSRLLRSLVACFAGTRVGLLRAHELMTIQRLLSTVRKWPNPEACYRVLSTAGRSPHRKKF
jgi:hypothetical protein